MSSLKCLAQEGSKALQSDKNSRTAGLRVEVVALTLRMVRYEDSMPKRKR
jgi:hypothetical protein